MEDIINEIKRGVGRFRNLIDNGKKPFVRVITHYDTDGITSGAILSRTLQRADIKFRLSIIKQLESKILEEITNEFAGKQEGILFFLDLGGNFEIIKKINAQIFILDHHETTDNFIPENITLINPFLLHSENDEISGAGLTYLFAKEFNECNKDLSSLAVIGMVGDVLGHSISKINNLIIQDSNVEVKKGISVLSSTKPLHRALEFSSELFIPGVTGNSEGVIQFLRDTGIKFDSNKTIINLEQDEMSKLVTAIILRKAEHGKEAITSNSANSILGNIYSLKFFNRTEDIRELSSVLNACGKSDKGDIALAFCLGSLKAKDIAETIYEERKRQIIEGINYIKNIKEKVENENYSIYNCKNLVKDSIIGTILSMMAFSFLQPSGKVLIGLAYRDDGKIKVSARIAKSAEGKSKNIINLKEVIHDACYTLGIDGESGGHANAAGCLVPVLSEEKFINALEQELQKKLK